MGAGKIIKEVIINFRTKTGQMAYHFKQARDGVTKLDRAGKKGLQTHARYAYQLGSINRGIRLTQKRMFGALISTMFFGMGISRVMMGIITPAFQEFMKVNGTALNANSESMIGMQANMKDALFTVGQAISGPDGLVSKISGLALSGRNYAEDNQEFVNAILEIGTTIGIILGVGGSTGLGVLGLIALFTSPAFGIPFAVGVALASLALFATGKDGKALFKFMDDTIQKTKDTMNALINLRDINLEEDIDTPEKLEDFKSNVKNIKDVHIRRPEEYLQDILSQLGIFGGGFESTKNEVVFSGDININADENGSSGILSDLFSLIT